MEVDSWITITILVTFIALIFQVGAFVSPMWYWLQTNSVYNGFGLWYAVGCSGATCTAGTAAAASLYALGQFVALRVLQSVGTAGVIALVVFLIVYKMGYNGKWGSMDTVNLAAFVICLFTILVLLASAAVFVAYFWSYFTLFDLIPNADRSSFPWSPMMSFVATLILIIVCVFIRLKCRIQAFSGGALPMSGDSKFDMHPQVHNGNASRYYNQTPYIEDRERSYTVVDDRHLGQSRTRSSHYEEYDDRRNGAPNNYEQRGTTYINRVYQTEAEPPAVYYTKPTARAFQENRDRELGHTIYTGNGFSYLKGEVNRAEVSRPDRDDVRYTGRPVALVTEYTTTSRPQADEYYDHIRSSGRQVPSSGRGYQQQSNVYMYRPHQY